MNLSEFLLARIAEDEAMARDAQAANIDTVVHEHIERWDPARVLAECEAKRRIVEEHPPFLRHCDTCHELDGPDVSPCLTLRVLAAVYSDHPDYDEARKP